MTKKYVPVTSKILKNLNACVYARRKFTRTFGKAGAALTAANMNKARKAELPMNWLVYAFDPNADLYDARRKDKDVKAAERASDRAADKSNRAYRRWRLAVAAFQYAHPELQPYTTAYTNAKNKDPKVIKTNRAYQIAQAEADRLYDLYRVAEEEFSARYTLNYLRSKQGQEKLKHYTTHSRW